VASFQTHDRLQNVYIPSNVAAAVQTVVTCRVAGRASSVT